MNEKKCKTSSSELFLTADMGPQTKRFKSLCKESQICASTKKRQPKVGSLPGTLSVQRTQQLSDGTPVTARKLHQIKKTWNCTTCTYANSAFLSYCEICETLREFGKTIL